MVYSKQPSVNETKTQNLLCTQRNYPLEGSESEVKLLEFIVDQKLMWGEHVQEVAKRLPRVLLLLRKLKNHVT